MYACLRAGAFPSTSILGVTGSPLSHHHLCFGKLPRDWYDKHEPGQGVAALQPALHTPLLPPTPAPAPEMGSILCPAAAAAAAAFLTVQSAAI